MKAKWYALLIPLLAVLAVLSACVVEEDQPTPTAESAMVPTDVSELMGTPEPTQTPFVVTATSPPATPTDTNDDTSTGSTREAPASSIARVESMIGETVEMPVDDSDEAPEVVGIEEIFLREDGSIAFIVIDTGSLFQPDNPLYAVSAADFEYTLSDDGETRSIIYVGDATAIEDQGPVDMESLQEGVSIDDDELDGDFAGMLRATHIMGSDIETENGDTLAEIEDIVINLDTGETMYVVADFGGFLSIGEKDIAIPWGQLSFITGDGSFTLPAEREMLQNAPEFSRDWSATGPAANWDDEYATYWEDAMSN